MGTLFKKYPSAILAVLALFFIVLVVTGIGWVVTVLAKETAEVVAVDGSSAGVGVAFNIEGAASLDLRGLVSSSSVSAVATSSAASSTPTSSQASVTAPSSTSPAATGTVSSTPVSAVSSSTATSTGD